jgi:hypothetical protein
MNLVLQFLREDLQLSEDQARKLCYNIAHDEYPSKLEYLTPLNSHPTLTPNEEEIARKAAIFMADERVIDRLNHIPNYEKRKAPNY